jgi:6-phosphofructokinase 1
MATDRGVEIAFAGIPKTIDNDIAIIDSSFGFATSCEVAAQMI